MLTIWGSKESFCDGISRRGFLQVGAFGAGLSLAELLRLRAEGAAVTRRSTSRKSAIMIYLPGGPSHMDMYDLKPDAPKEYAGEFKPIATNVPGVQISEHFPLQARMWDKLAVLRSVLPIDGAHTDSGITTGYSEPVNRTEHRPTVGCVVSKLRAGGDIPPYVSLRGPGNEEPGFLGVAHRPFHPRGPAVEDLRLANGVSMSRLDDRRELLAGFDTLRRDMDASGG